MLNLVVVVTDTPAEDAENYRYNDDYCGAYLACQIPLVLVDDLILRICLPVVDKIIP
jgi:hypothetical protein